MKEMEKCKMDFKMKLKNVPVSVFVIEEGKIVYASKSFCSIMGYGMDEIKGLDIQQFIPPEEKGEFEKVFRELMEGRKLRFDSEISLLHRDGKKRINVRISKDLVNYKGNKICVGSVQEMGVIEDAIDEIFSFLGRFYSFFEESSDAMYITAPNGKVIDINPAGVNLFGYKSKEDFLETNVKNHYLSPEDREDFRRTIEEKEAVRDYEITLKKKNGTLMKVSITANVMKDEKGEPIAYRGVIRDVTEHKKVEEKLREFQRMEALGRLAGGIAHDFNNLLTVILGNAEMLLRKIKPEDPQHERIKLIFETAEKAANLTSQLLSFSKSKSSSPMTFNPNTLIQKIGKFLSRTLGEKIKLDLLLNPEVSYITADPNQMEQVLLNLALNARDAMPEGGGLTISTDSVELKETECKLNPEAKPGKYAKIKVSDTGTGIPDEIIGRIFEPFFSTKEKGSGLGLSIVYGIVKQSGGFITVESEVGKGTTFTLFIPASEERINNLIKEEKEEKVFGKGKGKILVIEDDPSVLEFIKDVLESWGYKVLTACNGEEGIKIAKDIKGLDLIITDIVLPKKNGFETAREILKFFPEIRIIFISGYPANKINQIFEKDKINFLQKPFTPSILLEKIDNLLKK